MNPPITTATLLTAFGPGGLAAVRLFGPDAGDLLARLFVPLHAGDPPADSARLTLGRVVDPQTGETIDQAILRRLPDNHGAELTLHGGVRIVQRTLAACDSLGCHRLDFANPADSEQIWQQSLQLGRAAAIPNPALWADIELALPRARTRLVADWLIGQYTAGLAEALSGSEVFLRALLADYPARRRAIDGVRVAIVGPANAGKSTLFNALAGAEAAIVSAQPGTTRDYVWRWASLAGLPVELIDTAGLRAAAGELESQAVALAEDVVQSADLRLIVLDRTAPLDPADVPAMERLAAIGPAISVINKIDQPVAGSGSGHRVPGEIIPAFPAAEAIEVSASTGAGLADLVALIHAKLAIPDMSPPSPGLFTPRQVQLVEAALGVATAKRASLLRQLVD